jgi:hypothetical protein
MIHQQNQSGREQSYGGGNDGGYVDTTQRLSAGVPPGVYTNKLSTLWTKC